MPSLILPSTEVGLLSKEILNRNNQLRLLATGGSMLPTIRHEDILIVEPIKPTIRLRSIILFQNESGRVLAHRVIQMNKKNQFLMSGDANYQPDGWITYDQILGIVIGIERGTKIIDVYSFSSIFRSIPVSHIKNFRLILADFRRSIKKEKINEKGFFSSIFLHALIGHIHRNHPSKRAERFKQY